jgi:ligand-binding sensor domain-containing protein
MGEDQHGNLWIALNHGLLRLDEKAGILYNHPRRTAGQSGLRGVRKPENGSIWAGTEQGLARLKNGVFTTLPRERRRQK